MFYAKPETSEQAFSSGSAETWGLIILHRGRGGVCPVLAGSQQHPPLPAHSSGTPVVPAKTGLQTSSSVSLVNKATFA